MTNFKHRRPRRGSLGYSPRKRAKKLVPRVSAWKDTGEAKLLDYPGYKAGMTHAYKIDDRPHALSKGKEVLVPATVIETPPVYVFGIRGYKKTSSGLQAIGEVWSDNGHSHLGKRLVLNKKKGKSKSKKKKVDFSGADDIRLLVCTQPHLIHLKKNPDIMECGIGGKDTTSKLEFAEGVLGKEITVDQVFGEGDFVDVVSVTKGKGTQGVIKRWGVKIQDRKTDDARRHVGCIGPWKPHKTLWRVPFSGQMGNHTRTALNKRLLKMGSVQDDDVTPKGGFINYGILRTSYVLVKGSVAGPSKRIVRMRQAIRPPRHLPPGKPVITHVSLSSKQGV
ncbi:MAG: 50S ribosomal protein L3 [Theionarchaea archaeon]|nr:50S ribosomal protein L3 [Theionarchaea archaeon]MBU7036301.1 50S ribosomal protein L3 [Theionarchaea archaeon]